MQLSTAQVDRLSTAEVDATLRGLSPADWARARSLSHLCAAGLTGFSPEDLLHETVLKLLLGERVWRIGLHPLVVLKTAMHGVASNIRKKDDEGPIDLETPVTTLDESNEEGKSSFALATNQVTPERIVRARNELDAVEQLIGDDDELGLIAMAWGDGLKGQDAATELGIDMKQYEAARKRLMRKLAPLAAARRQS